MRRILFPVVVTLALGALAAGWALAEDVVHLTNGTRLSGRVVSLDEKTLVLEQGTGADLTRVTLKRAEVRAVELGLGSGEASRLAKGNAVRDEWWLLKSDGAVVGWRHLLVLPRTDESGSVWRLEERTTIFGTRAMPTVRVHRIEDVDAEYLPRHLHSRESGAAGPLDSGIPAYETIRSGPVRGGVWEATERGAKEGVARRVALPAGTRSALALRERIVRADPRHAGLSEVRLVDLARGDVRTVRAGFARLGAADDVAREDVLRVEDGARVLESKWVAADPPRCVEEEVAPGVVAVPSTRAKVEAASPKGAAPPSPSVEVEPDPGASDGAAPAKARRVSIADPGIEIPLPGASWTVETPPPPTDEGGRRVVAKVWSSLHAAEIRLEWDPAGAESPRGSGAPRGSDASADPETTVLEYLKRAAKDLRVVERRAAVASLPGAWRMTVAGTLNGENVRAFVLVAERGAGRALLLASCQEAAWDDAKEALESVVSGFRWL